MEEGREEGRMEERGEEGREWRIPLERRTGRERREGRRWREEAAVHLLRAANVIILKQVARLRGCRL